MNKTALGALLFAAGLGMLIYEAVHAQPRTPHDWGFIGMIGLGAFLMDPADVSTALAKVKDVLPWANKS